MKAMRNQPRKMAPMVIATDHAGVMLLLLTVANATANAVTDTVKKNFGNLVIIQSSWLSVTIFSNLFPAGYDSSNSRLRALCNRSITTDATRRYNSQPKRGSFSQRSRNHVP